jgi:hypothetical protein
MRPSSVPMSWVFKKELFTYLSNMNFVFWQLHLPIYFYNLFCSFFMGDVVDRTTSIFWKCFKDGIIFVKDFSISKFI